MSNRLLQSVIQQMKNSVDRIIGVVDENGTVIACSELVRIGEIRENVADELSYISEVLVYNDWTYCCIGSNAQFEYAVFVEGVDEMAGRYASILAISMTSIKQYYDEKFDKSIFIKNVILDNILPGEIYIKAKELHFVTEVNRVAILIRLSEKSDLSMYDVVLNIFPDKQRDYVINISETEIVLVKELRSFVESKEIEKMAQSIVDTMNAEFYVKTSVGIGTQAGTLKDIARSFKEAQIALEVGKVFDTEQSIINYENLGIGRLIYQLPTTLCEMFLNEIFKKGSIEMLDHETLFTIQKFFENNLNVSETSRKLFVHRNTLVYRLEKIRRLTGLDLREFDHAIVFKVALMVKKYLVSKPVKY